MARFGDSVEARCVSCSRHWIHILGGSDHVCERCGGVLICGYQKCVRVDEARKNKEESRND
jgi:predicted RNA-binding Zn-ribbon protein involved in translation (DUF1610 family)